VRRVPGTHKLKSQLNPCGRVLVADRSALSPAAGVGFSTNYHLRDGDSARIEVTGLPSGFDPHLLDMSRSRGLCLDHALRRLVCPGDRDAVQAGGRQEVVILAEGAFAPGNHGEHVEVH
jgi:hypothetical protein